VKAWIVLFWVAGGAAVFALTLLWESLGWYR